MTGNHPDNCFLYCVVSRRPIKARICRRTRRKSERQETKNWFFLTFKYHYSSQFFVSNFRERVKRAQVILEWFRFLRFRNICIGRYCSYILVAEMFLLTLVPSEKRRHYESCASKYSLLDLAKYSSLANRDVRVTPPIDDERGSFSFGFRCAHPFVRDKWSELLDRNQKDEVTVLYDIWILRVNQQWHRKDFSPSTIKHRRPSHHCQWKNSVMRYKDQILDRV